MSTHARIVKLIPDSLCPYVKAVAPVAVFSVSSPALETDILTEVAALNAVFLPESVVSVDKALLSKFKGLVVELILVESPVNNLLDLLVEVLVLISMYAVVGSVSEELNGISGDETKINEIS